MKTCVQKLFVALGWVGLLALPTLAKAQVNYAVSGSTAYVTNSKVSGNVVIASTYQGYPVTSIGEDAFHTSTDLRSVTIGNSVTSIGGAAFAFCTSLTNISVAVDNPAYSSANGVLFDKNQTTLIQYPIGLTNASYPIPDSVTSIGIEAFAWGTNLTSVIIGNGVTNIDQYAFENCSGLKSIAIPDSVASMGEWAFGFCTSLTNISVATDNPAYSSTNGVLFDKDQTTLIQYPVGLTNSSYAILNNVTSIGDEAIAGCTNLTSMVIGNGVTNIGDRTFFNCTMLTNVIIGSSVTNIGQYAFENCSGLKNLIIPDSVMGIGNGAFQNGSSLENLIIGSGLTNIGKLAFVDCTNLTSVDIPKSVTSIGDEAFSGCTSLTNFAVAVDNPAYSSTNGVLFDKNQTTLIQHPSALSDASYAIPNSVTTIGNYAFYFCTSLKNVTVPDSVTSIGNGAFGGCNNLTNVTIPDGVTSIGDGAFGGCHSLSSITVPNNVTSIGDGAFSGCDGLTNVVIGDSVKIIGYAAFFRCFGLTSITMPGSVTTISNSFWLCTGLTNFAVAADNPAYSSTNGVLFDKSQTTLIQYPSALANASYAVPDSVTSIGHLAFNYCPGLMAVVIPDSVTTIGNSAFQNSINLRNVVIGNGVTNMGGDVFFNCSQLTNVVIGNRVTSIGGNAFWGCGGLRSIVIPNSVTSIGDKAFYSCFNLTSVIIPDRVTSVGDSSFMGCDSLKAAYFQGNAPLDLGNAFVGDSAGMKVYYLPGTTGWGSTFGGVPAVLWNPQATVFSLAGGQFAFNITGPTNATIVVEACTNLANPLWLPVSTNTLTGGASSFSDPQSVNYPSRFYRFRGQELLEYVPL